MDGRRHGAQRLVVDAAGRARTRTSIPRSTRRSCSPTRSRRCAARARSDVRSSSVAPARRSAPTRHPYSLRTTYTGSSTKFDGLPLFTLGNTLANPNLKPENDALDRGRRRARLLRRPRDARRQHLRQGDANQIINRHALADHRLHARRSINAGKIENKGFEALLTRRAVPVATTSSGRRRFNYATNHGRVVTLYPGLQTIVLGGTWAPTVEARVGEPYGVDPRLRASSATATGKLAHSAAACRNATRSPVLGNIQPTWTGGWNNTVRYKSFTLNALARHRTSAATSSASRTSRRDDRRAREHA